MHDSDGRRALGLFLVLALLVFGDKLILGEYSLIRISDTFDTNVAEFKTTSDLLFKHGLFGWYPQLAGGRPSHAFHFTPIYPLVIAARFLPLWLIYAGMKILLMLTAGYGMFRFCRDYLGFEPDLALMAGVVFAFNSQTQVTTIIHAVFNFAFPLVFVWSLGITRQGRYSWMGAALGLILLSLLSYPVLTGPAFASAQFLLIMLLNPVHGKSSVRLLIKWAVFWVGYALIFLPLVYALLDFKDESQRSDLLYAVLYKRDLLHVVKHYGRELLGASLLIFPIGGAMAVAWHSSLVRRALLVNSIPFLFVVIFTSRAGEALRQTFLGKMELQLLFYVQNFLLTILALVGLRFVLRRRELLIFYLCGGTVGLLAMSAHLFLASSYGTLFFLNVLIPIGIYFYLRRRSVVTWPEAYSPPARVLTVVLLLTLVGIRVNIFHEGQEQVSYRRYFTSNPGLAEDLTRNGVGRVVTLGFHPSLAHNLGAESADGYSALFSGRYRAVWRVAMSGQLKDEADRRRFDWYWYEVNPLNGQTLRDFMHRVSPKYCPTVFEKSLEWDTPLLLASNVTVVVSLRPVRELAMISERVVSGSCPEAMRGRVTFNRLRRFFTPAPLWVYFLKDTFGRGYLVDRAEVLASDEEVLSALGRRTVAEFRGSVLLSAGDGHAATEERAAVVSSDGARVTLKEYTPDRLVFGVEATRPAYLVVTNNYNRRWTASIDGGRVEVLRANHAFQAVRIASAGRHEVVFEYQDQLLWFSYAAVPIGIGMLVVAARPFRMTEDAG